MIQKEIGHVVKFQKGIVGLIKQGWWQIPEVMGASCMALIGIGLAGIGLYNYARNNGENREYKMVYYIVRDGDPNGARIRNPVYTEYPVDPQEEAERKTGLKLKPKN